MNHVPHKDDDDVQSQHRKPNSLIKPRTQRAQKPIQRRQIIRTQERIKVKNEERSGVPAKVGEKVDDDAAKEALDDEDGDICKRAREDDGGRTVESESFMFLYDDPPRDGFDRFGEL